MRQYPTSDIPPGVITAADINYTLQNVQRDLASVLQRMAVSDAISLQARTVDTDHETRIRRLESFRWILVGVALAISSASGLITALLIK